MIMEGIPYVAADCCALMGQPRCTRRGMRHEQWHSAVRAGICWLTDSSRNDRKHAQTHLGFRNLSAFQKAESESKPLVGSGRPGG